MLPLGDVEADVRFEAVQAAKAFRDCRRADAALGVRVAANGGRGGARLACSSCPRHRDERRMRDVVKRLT